MAPPPPADPAAPLRALFDRQRARAPAVARTTAAERRERLARLRAAIVARRKDIAAAAAADLGRPAVETELAEIHPALAEIAHAMRHVGRWMRPERVGTPLLLFGTSSRIEYAPRGVALILAPWNYPFGLVVNPLVAAIAAGNCVVCKPSEKAPHTSAVVAELVGAAFDPAEVAVVEGGPDAAAALVELPFDHIFFTGGAAIGRLVMAAAARRLASVTLELGGKSPAVVDRSADVAAAARRIVWGKCFNAGQTCIAPDYALVHESQEGEFVAAATAAIARWYGPTEEARQESPDFARIVDDAHFRRLETVLERAVAAGARIVIGGRCDGARRYVAPTIVTGVTPRSPLMEEELFGPILPVVTYRTLDQAAAVMRAGGAPLALYVFARDRAAARALAHAVPAGGVTVNNTMLHYANPGLPFGGAGTSGMGRYHGVHGFREFSLARAVLRQREPALAELFFPPYRGLRHALARRLLRLLERR
jgi:aldehyde dehydrogenase (NAD+)